MPRGRPSWRSPFPLNVQPVVHKIKISAKIITSNTVWEILEHPGYMWTTESKLILQVKNKCLWHEAHKHIHTETLMWTLTCSSATGELSSNGGCVDCWAWAWAWGRGCVGKRFCPLCLSEGNNLVHCNNPVCTNTQRKAAFSTWHCTYHTTAVTAIWRQTNPILISDTRIWNGHLWLQADLLDWSIKLIKC